MTNTHGDIYVTEAILLRPVEDGYDVVDLNYGCVVGTAVCNEGPGWILTKIQMSFLDAGQLFYIGQALNRLNKDIT